MLSTNTRRAAAGQRLCTVHEQGSKHPVPSLVAFLAHIPTTAVPPPPLPGAGCCQGCVVPTAQTALALPCSSASWTSYSRHWGGVSPPGGLHTTWSSSDVDVESISCLGGEGFAGGGKEKRRSRGAIKHILVGVASVNQPPASVPFRH